MPTRAYTSLIRPIPAISGLILPQAMITDSGFFVGDVTGGNLTLHITPDNGGVFFGMNGFPATLSVTGDVNIGSSGTNYNLTVNGNDILEKKHYKS
jgi:hypothetical protein